MTSIRKKNHRILVRFNKIQRKCKRNLQYSHAIVLRILPMYRKMRWHNINKASDYTRWERWRK